MRGLLTDDAAHLQEPQTAPQMVTELCGFSTIVIGTFLLHATRDLDISLGAPPCSWQVLANAHGRVGCRAWAVCHAVLGSGWWCQSLPFGSG